jgi:hypothetical protein
LVPSRKTWKPLDAEARAIAPAWLPRHEEGGGQFVNAEGLL